MLCPFQPFVSLHLEFRVRLNRSRWTPRKTAVVVWSRCVCVCVTQTVFSILCISTVVLPKIRKSLARTFDTHTHSNLITERSVQRPLKLVQNDRYRLEPEARKYLHFLHMLKLFDSTTWFTKFRFWFCRSFAWLIFFVFLSNAKFELLQSRKAVWFEAAIRRCILIETHQLFPSCQADRLETPEPIEPASNGLIVRQCSEVETISHFWAMYSASFAGRVSIDVKGKIVGNFLIEGHCRQFENKN